jgi:DNA repair protein RadC
MAKTKTKLAPIINFNDADFLISQALHCLEARLQFSSEKLNNPQNAKNYLRLSLATELDEVFGVLFLDNRMRLLSFEKMFYGTINEAKIYPRKIIRKALDFNAAKIILAHNHPSGDCTPSKSDNEICNDLIKVLVVLDITLLDHIIVSHTDSFSCAEHGLL